MSSQIVNWMTAAVVAGIFILLAMNLSTHLQITGPHEVFIKPGEVKGSSVEHKGKLFTLNFNQQNNLIDYLNTAVPVKKSDYENAVNKTEISKIILVRFNAPDIEITPIGLEGKNLVFSAPTWNNSSYLMDLSGGQLVPLLESTYDH